NEGRSPTMPSSSIPRRDRPRNVPSFRPRRSAQIGFEYSACGEEQCKPTTSESVGKRAEPEDLRPTFLEDWGRPRERDRPRSPAERPINRFREKERLTAMAQRVSAIFKDQDAAERAADALVDL